MKKFLLLSLLFFPCFALADESGSMPGEHQMKNGQACYTNRVNTFTPNQTFLGTGNALGTITSGIWNGSVIGSTYLPSATVYNNQSNTYTTGTQDLTSATALKVPNSGGAAPTAEASVAYDTTQHRYAYGENGGTTGYDCHVVSVDNATNTSGNNLVASTINTTETVFASSYTVKANTFIQNKVLRVTAVFDVVSSATAVSFRTRLRWGGLAGTILSDSGAVTVNNSAIKGALLQFIIQGTAAAGASANVEIGKSWQVSGGGGTQLFGFETIQSPVAVATNADKVLQFTELFGGNTAANSVTLRQWMVEQCN